MTDEMEPLDIYIAVFNCLPQDQAVATRRLNQAYGPETYRKYIAPCVKNGVVAIYEGEPNVFAELWVRAIADAVKRRRAKEKP